ncbi:MAG: peptidase U62, partial [Acidobacteriota bacterium]|nr:peptidase U62 [Acidobacteriota bacterium]
MSARNPWRRMALSALGCIVACSFAAGARAQGAPAATAADSDATAAAAKAAASDPLLQAMQTELQRSRAHLKMVNVPAPYYIDYRLTDTDEYNMEAAFGALRMSTHVRARYIRVVVRVGDYKQDSYFGPGLGMVNFAPLEDNPESLRWQLWEATDRAYKIASQALAAKRAVLSQYAAGQPFDDFARATPVQSIEPLVAINFDAKAWEKIVEKATDLYRSDPNIQTLNSVARCWAVNQYFLNMEGT